MASYDFRRVIVQFNGHIVQGFAEGTSVNAEMNEEDWALTVGGGGAYARSRTNDNSGRVTLTLLHTSLSNPVLSAFRALDKALGTGRGPLTIKDLNSLSPLVIAPIAWIVGAPPAERGNEITNVEWVFESGNMEITHSGVLL